MAAVVAVAAAFAAPGAGAQRPAPKADPRVQSAMGAVIEYQESQDTNVLYREEKGGMVSLVASPAAPARTPAKAAEPVPAPTERPARLPELPKR